MFEVSTTNFHTNVDEHRLVAERAKFAKQSWFLRAFVSVGKEDCISFQTRPKWMLNFVLKHCCRNLFKIADLFCHLASSFNRTARLHTCTAKLAQDWIATNCTEFIGKDEWPPNSPDLNPVDYHVWGSMLERYKSFQPSRRISIDELKKVDGTSCHKTRSTKPYWASQKLRPCVKAGGKHFEHTLK